MPSASPNAFNPSSFCTQLREDLKPYLPTPDGDARPLTPEQIEVERKRCAVDICYWVNTYGWTFDPREIDTEPTLPFKLFPKQEEFLLWLQAREAERKGGLAEKSRDVGFTWLCSAYAVHGWLFRKGFTAGFGSRKVELVDKKGDPKCIFEKIRFLVEHLPDWMLPKDYSPVRHAGFCKLINPENGASITGEGGAQIGRGGRTSIYFIDEAAFLQYPTLADAALSANSRVKIWVSTPNGVGNSFYKKRFGGKLAVFTFRWQDDPRKNLWIAADEDGNEIGRGNGYFDAVPEGAVRVRYPWYEEQKDELDEVTLAQEVDIDYTASVEGICIQAKWVRAAVGLQLPDSADRICGLDVGGGGKDPNVLIRRRGNVLLDPIVWNLNGTQTAHRAADETETFMGSCLSYDAVGVGFAVQSAFESMEREVHFTVNPVLGQQTPSETKWSNGKTSKEMFLNLRAELYWKLRTRFEKTYEFVVDGINHPLEDLISIPNDATLIAELSVPLTMKTETGKIKIESKEDMRKRGVSSPNHADAAAYTEADGGSSWKDVNERLERAERGGRRESFEGKPPVW